MMDFGEDEKNGPLIIGGEIISPGARLVSEKDNSGAEKRSWFSAITSAAFKAGESGDVKDLLSIIQGGMERGIISKEEVNSHLLSINFDVNSFADKTGSTKNSGKAIDTEQDISESQIRAHLNEIEKQIPKVKDGSLSLSSFQQSITEAKQKGVPVDQLKRLLISNGISVNENSVENEEQNTQNEQKEVVKPLPLTELEIKEMKQVAGRKAREYMLADQSPNFFAEDDSDETPIDLMISRNQLPDSIGRRFDAHGLAKVSSSFQFDGLINLLNNGIDPSRPFHSMSLFSSNESEAAAAMGAAGPYDNGGFIVIGRPKSLNENSSEHLMKFSGIAGVLVNREWYDAIPRLQQAYPNIRFIRADEMEEELTKWVEEVDRKN